MLFFISDTHFGANDAIIREGRKFKNYKKFDKYVIKLWNKQANSSDIIYHLGDFINFNEKDKTSWKKSLLYVKKIKSKIVLIIGNNEERLIREFFNNNFDSFKQYCKSIGFFDVKTEEFTTINGQNIYLNHYPIRHKKDFFNLFGHTHRVTGLWKPFGINVGCDLNYFYLYSDKDIEHLMKMKEKFWDIDENNIIMN